MSMSKNESKHWHCFNRFFTKEGKEGAKRGHSLESICQECRLIFFIFFARQIKKTLVRSSTPWIFFIWLRITDLGIVPHQTLIRIKEDQH